MTISSRKMLDYALELRRRLLQSLMVATIICLVLLPFSNTLYHLLAEPLLIQLPHGNSLIATALTASFFIPLKFTMLVAAALAIPFILYQFWMFIAPALYHHERHWMWLLLLLSTVLFYSGMLFAYWVVFPILFKFFIQTAPAGVTVLPDISQYLALVSQFFLSFGLAFEVPVVIVVLTALKITTLDRIKQQRRYFFVLAFVVAMLLAPPDVVSQTLLAIPLCLLFEVGLLLARILKPNNKIIEKNE